MLDKEFSILACFNLDEKSPAILPYNWNPEVLGEVFMAIVWTLLGGPSHFPSLYDQSSLLDK